MYLLAGTQRAFAHTHSNPTRFSHARSFFQHVAAMPKKWRGLEEATSDRSAFPPPSPDAMASPQHSSLSDGSTSSGYPAPYLSLDSPDSGYSWLLDRPPRLSPNLPASLHESASPSPHPSSSGSLEPWWLQRFAPERRCKSWHLRHLSITL
jgi:hypothetical protein